MTIAPIDLHKPIVVLLAVLLAAFSHFYPKYILPRIKYWILTSPTGRKDFAALYNKFIEIAKEAKPLEGKTNEFAQFSLKKRELNKIFKVLENYPRVYWEPYPKKNIALFTLLDTNTDNALNSNERLNKILNQSDFSIIGWLLGYIPTVLFFVMYCIILICYNWSYVLFTYHDAETSPLAATALADDHEQTKSAVSSFIYILSWLPTSILSTLSSASTSFWMLHLVVTSALNHVLPLHNTATDTPSLLSRR